MQTFYMLIGSDAFYIYEKVGDAYDRQYFDGNPEYHFRLNDIEKEKDSVIDMLAAEYNLDDKSALTFVAVGSGESAVNEKVRGAFREYISKFLDLSTVMSDVIQEIDPDGELLIKEYGINYDGKNYCLREGSLRQGEFSLLGYTLSVDDFLKYIG